MKKYSLTYALLQRLFGHKDLEERKYFLSPIFIPLFFWYYPVCAKSICGFHSSISTGFSGYYVALTKFEPKIKAVSSPLADNGQHE